MKIFLILILSCISFMNISYVKEVANLENTIFELYENGFEEYLVVDEFFEIGFDKVKLKKDLENKGYYVEFYDGCLDFEISFKKYFVFKKRYSFYLEKSYAFQQFNNVKNGVFYTVRKHLFKNNNFWCNNSRVVQKKNKKREETFE